MLNTDETAFLAQMAMGWFSADEEGRLWRHAQRVSGRGNARLKRLKKPRRAERSASAKGGYLRVMFADETTRRRVAAHRIVWIVTHGQPIPEGFEINHRDGNKRNNHPANLEVVTRSENTRHAIHVLGKIHPKARGKLSMDSVRHIRQVYAAKSMTLRELAGFYGVHWHTIQKIVNRETWRDV